MAMKTYTLKVDEELYNVLRKLNAETVRKILREAINSETFKKEMIQELEKQMKYYMESMELRFKEASKMKNQVDFILNRGKEMILVEAKSYKKNEHRKKTI